MYYLKDFCFLCFEHNKKYLDVTVQNLNGVFLREKLNSIVPEYLFLREDVPKYICADCFDKIDNICKFREQCVANIHRFDDYVQKLTKIESKHSFLEVPVVDVLCSTKIIKTEDDLLEEGDFEVNYDHLMEIKEETFEVDFETLECIEKEHCYARKIDDLNKILESELESTTLHKCPICNENFSHCTKLYLHKFTHGKTASFQCIVCDKIVPTKFALERHMRLHFHKFLDCNVCKQPAINMNKLNYHMISKHPGQGSFTCRSCHQIFSSYNDAFRFCEGVIENNIGKCCLEFFWKIMTEPHMKYAIMNRHNNVNINKM